VDSQRVGEFSRNLRRLEYLAVAQLREDTSFRGITVAQCHCLLAVEQLGRPSQNEVAEWLCLDKSSLSRTVEGLVRTGFLVRTRDVRDRRVYRLCLTEQGEKISGAVNASNDAVYAKALDQLTMDPEKVVAAFAAMVQALAEVKGDKFL
jgi:DNA-binding MarR family transcriptional regulator